MQMMYGGYRLPSVFFFSGKVLSINLETRQDRWPRGPPRNMAYCPK